MKQFQSAAIGPNRPNAIDFLPSSFVAKQNLLRIARRKLSVIKPSSFVVHGLDLARRDVHRKQNHRAVAAIAEGSAAAHWYCGRCLARASLATWAAAPPA